MSTRGRRSRAAPSKPRETPPEPGNAAAGARRVPIIGYIGPGSEAHFYGQRVKFHESQPGTAATVLGKISGDCLGSYFNGGLLAYDDLRLPPSRDLIGRLCVVALADGRVLVNQLQQGEVEGMFDLISLDPPIRNVAIRWAAPVKAIYPRNPMRGYLAS